MLFAALIVVVGVRLGVELLGLCLHLRAVALLVPLWMEVGRIAFDSREMARIFRLSGY
jgi:hypothetical protein